MKNIVPVLLLTLVVLTSCEKEGSSSKLQRKYAGDYKMAAHTCVTKFNWSDLCSCNVPYNDEEEVTYIANVRGDEGCEMDQLKLKTYYGEFTITVDESAAFVFSLPGAKDSGFGQFSKDGIVFHYKETYAAGNFIRFSEKSDGIKINRTKK